MDIASIATSSLLAAQRVVNVHANNIVNAQTQGFSPATPVLISEAPIGGVAVFVQEADSPVNLVQETLWLITATNQYEAAAALLRTDDSLSRTLLDTFG